VNLKRSIVVSENYKIIIIDEDIKFVQFLEKIFVPLNYKIYSTSNPRKALKLMDKINAEVVFIDDNISGISPIDLLSINKNSNENCIRFLTSVSPKVEFIIEAFNNKLIYQYISKPIKEKEIIEHISKALIEKEEEVQKENFYNYCKNLEAEGAIEVKLEDVSNVNSVADEDVNEKRRYFRVKTFVPICSDMRIMQIKDKVVDTPFTKICVLDLSAGGFRFLSELKLPISSEVVLEFQTNILDNKLLLIGHVVRLDIMEEHIFEYGVEFRIDENKKSQLIRLLNEMQIDIRNNKTIRGCSFCTKENQIQCLKTRIKATKI
jgi:DNA-binding response OmpR family regulator